MTAQQNFLCLFTAFLLAFVAGAGAQQPGKVPCIGVVTQESASDPTYAERDAAFRQGLRDLGYIEGKNIHIEYKYAEGKSEQLAALAQELVRLKVNILVVTNDLTARAAKKSTATIPIVMTGSGNPIGSGVIASLARPGGNITGLTSYSAELLGKRLELLHETVPQVSKFAFLNDVTNEQSASGIAFKDAQGAAKTLGVKFN